MGARPPIVRGLCPCSPSGGDPRAKEAADTTAKRVAAGRLPGVAAASQHAQLLDLKNNNEVFTP